MFVRLLSSRPLCVNSRPFLRRRLLAVTASSSSSSTSLLIYTLSTPNPLSVYLYALCLSRLLRTKVVPLKTTVRTHAPLDGERVPQDVFFIFEKKNETLEANRERFTKRQPAVRQDQSAYALLRREGIARRATTPALLWWEFGYLNKDK